MLDILNTISEISSLYQLIEDKEKCCEYTFRSELFMGICDGTKSDCLLRGKEMCTKFANCYGVMWDDGWGKANKGVVICTWNTLISKPGALETHLKKCNTGILA